MSDVLEKNQYTGLLPGLGSEGLENLRASIAAHGVLVPVIKDQDGNTIDGFHRELIADELGLDLPIEVRQYQSEAARKADALAMNLTRRNLTSEQRAEVREHQKQVYSELREQNLTQAQAAAMVGVAHQTGSSWEKNKSNSTDGNTFTAKDRREKLEKEDVEEIVRRSEAGHSQQSIGDDFGITQQRVGQVVKREQAKRDRQDELRNKALGEGSGQAVIHKESAQDLLARNLDIDLLLTDPPFSTDIEQPIEDFVESWLPSALGSLKPTGRAYVFFGAYPDEVIAYLDCFRRHQWTHGLQLMGWTYTNTLGPEPKLGYTRNWQTIAYAHGPEAGELNSDRLVDKVSIHQHAHPARSRDRVHPWQKPDALAEMFIQQASTGGDLVVDPFAGSGTFLAAAARLGRNAIGSDLDPSAVQIAVDRGVKHVR